MSELKTLGIPVEDSPPEVLGTMHYALVSLGTQLGRLYDDKLSEEIGPNWLSALGKHRNKFYTLNDPHFVLSEPLRFPDSPTRWCLPKGGAFYNLLEDTLRVRNAWAHFEVPLFTFETLKPSILTIQHFAQEVGLPVAGLCSAVIRRINAITNGQYTPPQLANQTGDIESQLRILEEQLAEAKAREDTLAADILAAQALLDEAAIEKVGQPTGDYVQQLEDKLLTAAEEMERLQFLIESLAAQEVEPDNAELVAEIAPGQEWTSALPSRRTVIMGLANDLFDEGTKSGIADEFGPHARDVIATWRGILPPMTPVFVTPHGQAVAHLDGIPTYLGTLGELPVATTVHQEQIAQGFFIPHTYTLRLNGCIENRDTGESLLNVNPQQASVIAQRLLAAVPRGGRLRVTTMGEVARHQNGEWVIVAKVSPVEWFPGHLS